MFKLAMLAAFGWKFGCFCCEVASELYVRLSDKFIDTCRKSDDVEVRKAVAKYDKARWSRTYDETKNPIGF